MQKYLYEARSLLVLATPIVFSQASQTGFGVVDTIMSGKVSATDLAGVALGSSIWLPVILFCSGFLMILSPIVAQLNGAGKRKIIPHQVRQSYWLGLFLSIFVIVIFYNSHIVIEKMGGENPELVRVAVGYLRAVAWGAPGFLFFQIMRSRCEGVSKTLPSMIIGITALLFNIPINYIFIYGAFGIPAFGGIGCGIATAIVYWGMFFCMRHYIKHSAAQRDIQQHDRFEWLDRKTFFRHIQLGMPVAFALFIEVSLFSVVSLLIAPLGVTAIAGHQIALNFSGFVFVFPLSMSISAAIRVSHYLGEGSPAKARVAGYTGLGLSLLLAMFTALLTVLCRENIALLYNDQPDVVLLASSLMLLAALYQCPDSIQVVGTGILRGYKETHSIFLITLIAYWVIALPVGYLLGLTDVIVPRMGPAGFWCGFIVGLTISSILVSIRLRWLHKQSDIFILARSSH